jgi:hypothetical protein
MRRTSAPGSDRLFHIVRFQEGAECDAFVRALQRFLDSPRGSAFVRAPRETEIWAASRLAERPLEVYLSDDALAATEMAFASPPVAGTRTGNSLPSGSVLVLRGAELVIDP